MKKKQHHSKSIALETETTPSTKKKSNFLSIESTLSILLLILLLFIVFIIRSKFKNMPFERDEGIYSYFGTLIIEGKTPYKDFYELKFPGLYYFYGFMVYVFGATVKGMHEGFMYLNLATIIILYYASRVLFNPTAAIITAITFAFVSLTPNLSGFTVQSEHGVAFFISLGILFYALSKKYNNWYWYALMGFAMGCSLMVKTNGVFLCLWGALILISDYIFTKEKNLKSFLINFSQYTAGGVSIVAVLFLIILGKDAFSEMIFWTYEYSKHYMSNVPLETGLKYFNNTKDAVLHYHLFFWVHSILAIALCMFKTIDIKYKVLGISLLLFSFFTILPGLHFYGHYFIQLIPGISIVSGLALYSTVSIANHYLKEKGKAIKYVYLTIFLLLTYSHVNTLKAYYFKPNYERILRAVYGNNPFPEAMQVGNFINKNALPEDNIVLIGAEPQVYFYTKKKSPSRHAYFAPIVKNVPQHKVWQREFTTAVEKAAPRYFIYFDHPISLLVQPNTDRYVFEWANKYISENYKLVGFIDMIDGQRTKYLWGSQINNYKPVPGNNIFIYERKKTTKEL